MRRSGINGVGLTAAAVAAILASGAATAATCYVKSGAPAGNDGSTWASATALQTALANVDCSELWVAAGIYKPTAGADRSVSFVVRPGTAVYGGFAGTETARAQRDPAASVTILSGDIDDNDTGVGKVDASTADIQGGNSYHVLRMNGKVVGQAIDGATVVDGFVITGGAATGSYPDTYGGGLYCDASLAATAVCSPTLNNLLFSGNLASTDGGAIFNQAIYGGNASPTITNVTFRGNGAINSGGTARGGAIYNEGYGGHSSPVLTNVTFAGNTAANNSANAQGGAMYNSGYYGISNPVLTNVTFSGNSADFGGAIFDEGIGGTCNPVLVNTILWGNSISAGGSGPQIDEANGARATITYSVVEGGCPTNNPLECDGTLITADPKLGPLHANGGFAPTFALGVGSSAIDAGSDAGCPAADERGVTRPQGAHCDVGAFESDRIFLGAFEAP
jgi:predicted outer membrane repeat protein